MGLSISALTAAAMSSAPREQASQVSSLLGATRQIGVALGVALVGAVIGQHVGAVAGTPGYGPAFIEGLRAALRFTGGLSLLGAVCLWWALGPAAAPLRPALLKVPK